MPFVLYNTLGFADDRIRQDPGIFYYDIPNQERRNAMLPVCTVTQAQQPDYVALAIVGVLLLCVAVAVLRKYFAKKKANRIQ